MTRPANTERPFTLTDLRRHQHSVATMKQLIRAGVAPTRTLRNVRADVWARMAHGIYDLDPRHPHPLRWPIAAALRADASGTSYAIGGLTAARQYGLTRTVETPITVWVPTKHLRADLPGCRIREDGQHRLGRTNRAEWPHLTCPEDTVIDLAGELDGFEMAAVLAAALQKTLLNRRSLENVLDQRTRVHGRGLLNSLLEDCDGLDSILEVILARPVLAAHGLPEPIRQARITRHSICDALIEEYALILEADGATYHDAEADADRDAEHTRLGFTTLRFGSRRLIDDPCGVAADIATTLAERGWSGSLRACPRCPDPGTDSGGPQR